MKNQFDLLKTRRFLPLFIVQFFGAFNDQTFKTAFMALLTYRLADQLGLNIDFHNQLAAALFILPFALFAPIAGQISDRTEKSRFVVWVKFTELLLMGLAVVAYNTQNITLLYILLFFMGAQSAFFSPVKYGLLPQYLKRSEIVAGNGLIQAATFIAIISGQILGIKLALSEGGIIYVSFAVVLFAIIGLIAAFFTPKAPPYSKATKVNWNLFGAISSVLSDARKHAEPYFALIAIAWFWFIGSIILTFILPIAKGTLQASEDASLALLAAFVFGVAFGAALTNRLSHSAISYKLSPIGALGIALGAFLCYLSLAYYEPENHSGELMGFWAFIFRFDSWLVLISLFIMALFAGLYMTPLNVIYTTTCPADQRGRFVAASNVIDSIAMIGAALLSMVLLQIGLDRIQIIGLSGATGLVVAAVIYLHHRKVREGLSAQIQMDQE